MRLKRPSIFRQIALAFFMIIILTSVLSVFFEYFSTRDDLPGLLTGIRTRYIAQYLSSMYSADRSWDNLPIELQRLTSIDIQGSPDSSRFRLIVRDTAGHTLYNSFDTITSLGTGALIEGEQEVVTDLTSGKQIASVTLYISEDYLKVETRKYLINLLTARLRQEGFTVIGALIIAILLSRRITQPLSRLSRAIASMPSRKGSGKIEVSGSRELVELGRSFNEMAESLEKQKTMRKRLVADLAHDLGNPLNAIRLEARGLKDGLVGVEEAANGIIADVDALGHLVYDLELLVEADLGEIRMNRDYVPFLKFLNSQMSRWQPKAELAGKSLVLEVTSSLPSTIQIDSPRMSMALGNLLDNAVKHSPHGSSLRLCADSAEDGVRIEVRDDGPIIPDEVRKHIFDRLYRGDPSRNRDIPGSGLGLAIVKQIVSLHGGRVELLNEHGNCFRITLPADPSLA